MTRYVLLKDLPIEKAGTVIVSNGEDWVVEDTGVSFPYSPTCNPEWFKREVNWQEEHRILEAKILNFFAFVNAWDVEKKQDIMNHYKECFGITEKRL